MPSAPATTEGPASAPFASVGIVGLGVMGGSLAMALRARDQGCVVVGWDSSPRELEAASRAGAISRRASSFEDALGDVELVVLAVPVQAVCALAPLLQTSLPEGALVHDVASLKEPVRAAMAQSRLAHRWIGGHPMCGSEASGFQAARAELYDGARVWIVADDAPSAPAARVEALWRWLGARPRRTGAAPHDELMAMVSHLPQLTSNLLAQGMARAGVDPADLGPGGLETTRLAASSPDMWVEILMHAPAALPAALRELGREAARLAEALEENDLHAVRTLMEATRTWRRPS